MKRRGNSWVNLFSFFGYFPLLLLSGLKVSIFDRRSVEDWLFGFIIYIISLVIFPSFKFVGSILTFTSFLWCLFIWFIYRFPFSDLTKPLNKFFDKRFISTEDTKISITSPFGFHLYPQYLFVIYFWLFFIFCIMLFIGLAPLAGHILPLIFVVSILLLIGFYSWISIRKFTYYGLGSLITLSGVFLLIKPGFVTLLALIISFTLFMLLAPDEFE